jgi:hypothetical protein
MTGKGAADPQGMPIGAPMVTIGALIDAYGLKFILSNYPPTALSTA